MDTRLTRPRVWLGRLCGGGSFALLISLAACYTAQFDLCTAITVFPHWVWLIPGLGLTAIYWQLRKGKSGSLLAAMWLLFLFMFVDSPISLVRGVWTSPVSADDRQDRTLRVVTLNCQSSLQGLVEAASVGPDLILLQESPSREAVEEFTRAHYGAAGGFLWGSDTSIIAAGEVTPLAEPDLPGSRSVIARVRLASGLDVVVVSLRLQPVPFRLDHWSPDCWRSYAENRKVHRAELEAIVGPLEHGDLVEMPVILGGDFNATPADPIFRLLRPRLADGFRKSGVGWGNTILNDFPAIRIDQIWTSDEIQPIAVWAARTEHSDHRMVAGDFELPP